MWMDIAQEVDQEPKSDEEDTVYDRTNKNPFESGSELRVMLDEQPDTRCGIGSWRPDCLQRWGDSKALFSVTFIIVGMIQGSFWTFYTATLSTFEKRFKIDSTTSGVLLFANELAQILVAVIFTYFGFRRHAAKILTLGVAFSSLSCFLMASPHYFVGSGEMALQLVKPSEPVQQYPMLPKALPLTMENDDGTNDGGDSKLDDLFSTTSYVETVSTTASASTPIQIANATVIVKNDTIPSTIVTTGAPSVPTDSNSTTISNTETTPEANSNSTTAPLSESDPSPSSAEPKVISETVNVTSTSTTLVTTEATSEHSTTNSTTPAKVESTSEEDANITKMFPYLNDQMTTVWPMCNRDTEDITKKDGMQQCKIVEFERKLAFTFTFVANFVGGIASMLFLLSGGPYAEDSTIMPNELPRIFGITLALRLIGPFFGYLFAWSCLSEFISPKQTVIQYDSRWLGAWWLGWTCLGIFMAISAFIFSLFPRQSPREFLKKRSLTHETGSAMLLIPNIVGFLGGSELKAANPLPTILNIPNVLQGLLRNQVYFLLTISTLIHIFVGVGYWTFVPKYLEFMFRVKSADAAILSGISSVPFQVAGLMLSGAFISRYLPGAREISSWSCIVTSVQIATLLIVAFFGCATDKVDTSFLLHQTSNNNLNKENENILSSNTSTSPSTTTLLPFWNSTSDHHYCSADCDCGGGPILPVCDLYTETTYFSPCHAGCEKIENQTEFLECSCLPYGNSTLTEGFCPTDNCSNELIAFLILTGLAQLVHSSGVVGRMLLSVKSIQADQRTAIIGFTLLTISVMSVIPSPIVFGSIFESACIVRENSSCDGQPGNCWLYDDSSLRFAFNLGTGAFLVLALIFDVLLWKSQSVYELRIYDGELHHQATSLEPGVHRSSTVS